MKFAISLLLLIAFTPMFAESNPLTDSFQEMTERFPDIWKDNSFDRERWIQMYVELIRMNDEYKHKSNPSDKDQYTLMTIKRLIYSSQPFPKTGEEMKDEARRRIEEDRKKQ